MEDKVLQTMNEMYGIIKNESLTYLEKDEKIKNQNKKLDKKEKRILKKACKRRLQSFNRLRETTELVSTFFTGIGFFITLFGIFYSQRELDAYTYNLLIFAMGIYVMIGVAIVWITQMFTDKKINQIQWILDCLMD